MLSDRVSERILTPALVLFGAALPEIYRSMFASYAKTRSKEEF